MPLPPPPPSASSHNHSRRGSLTSSEATSLSMSLATPAESLAGSSIRESSIFPRAPGSVDSRGSSQSSQGQGQYGKGLPTLPEDTHLDRLTSTSRKEYSIHQPQADPYSQHSGGAPPSAYSSHQAQIIQALSTYQMDGRMPVTIPQPGPLSSRVQRSPSLNSGHGHYTGHGQGHGQSQSPYHSHSQGQGQGQYHQSQDLGFHAYAPPSQQHYSHSQQQDIRHLSHLTNSSSSSASNYSDDAHVNKRDPTVGEHGKLAHISGMSGMSGSTADFHIHLDSSSSVGMSTLSRMETNSSESTGASSKRLAKDEKKA